RLFSILSGRLLPGSNRIKDMGKRNKSFSGSDPKVYFRESVGGKVPWWYIQLFNFLTIPMRLFS
ncbi:MAG: hypothetical protein U9R57_15390, partial [Thermodesulfobacteriota bacterium]|nr:hypothetical protein [Thermodesulfobacteriota bacterium]